MSCRKNTSGIYILMFPNKTYYIGSSINIHYRLSQHFNALLKNKHVNIYIQNVWNKYKELSSLVIHLIDDETMLRQKEQELIDKSIHDKKCLNINPSAIVPPFYEKIVHEYDIDGKYITSRKSLAETARVLNLSTGAICDVISGKKNHVKQKRFSYKKLKKLPKIKISPKQDGIYDYWLCQYDLKGNFVDKFNNIKDYCRKTNQKYSSRISTCISNTTLTSRNSYWRRFLKSEIIPLKIEIN